MVCVGVSVETQLRISEFELSVANARRLVDQQKRQVDEQCKQATALSRKVTSMASPTILLGNSSSPPSISSRLRNPRYIGARVSLRER